MIHWLGLGLSSYVGIKNLKSPFLIWMRDPKKGSEILKALGRQDVQIRQYTLDGLLHSVQKGDVVVSMFPATEHLEIAKICLEKEAHLVTSSYVSAEMKALHDQAAALGCVFLNEVGLDPGLDHLFAHELFSRNQSVMSEPGVTFKFQSLCGGMPEAPNRSPLFYRFSWSPAGVLRALKNPLRWIEDGMVRTAENPADQVRSVRLSGFDEDFEMYPNRDSLEFLEEYAQGHSAHAVEFVRGTLRPLGWRSAWNPIFQFLGSNPNPDEVEKLAERLFQENSYQQNDQDRVVLHVELEATHRERGKLFAERMSASLVGSFPFDSAMSKLVSIPVLIGIDEVLNGRFEPGVHRMPSGGAERARWFSKLEEFGLDFQVKDSQSYEGSRLPASPHFRIQRE